MLHKGEYLILVSFNKHENANDYYDIANKFTRIISTTLNSQEQFH